MALFWASKRFKTIWKSIFQIFWFLRHKAFCYIFWGFPSLSFFLNCPGPFVSAFWPYFNKNLPFFLLLSFLVLFGNQVSYTPPPKISFSFMPGFKLYSCFGQSWKDCDTNVVLWWLISCVSTAIQSAQLVLACSAENTWLFPQETTCALVTIIERNAQMGFTWKRCFVTSAMRAGLTCSSGTQADCLSCDGSVFGKTICAVNASRTMGTT